ncbi:MAG: hypothetical protein JSS02_24155 [Planctomycetes bacterium]|nr:hypothetical protein [Planctomycetota bacterium]
MHQTSQHQRKPSKRRGIATLQLIVSAALVLLIFTLVIDIGFINARLAALQTLTDAAALAGATALVENAPAAEFNPLGAQSVAYLEADSETGLAYDLAMSEARFAAAEVAALNPVSGYTVQLENQTDGTVTSGWVEQVQRGRSNAFEFRATGAVNAIEVETRLPLQGLSIPTLSLLTAVGQKQLTAAAVAVWDQKIIGFRPYGTSPVPALPVMALIGPWDNLAADTTTTAGADAGSIPLELLPGGLFELTIGPVGPASAASRGTASFERVPVPGVGLQFGPEVSSTAFNEQIVEGLDREALADLEGAIRIDLGERIPLLLGPAAAQLGTSDSAFSSLIGEQRVLLTGHVAPDALTAIPTGFMAVVIVNVQVSGTEIRLKLNPVRMQTDTAIISDAAWRNPWVGKVVLVR